MRPQRQTIKSGTIPAPVGGINGISSLGAMPATDAINMRNIEPTSRGARVRPGYTVGGFTFPSTSVHSIFTFNNSNNVEEMFVGTIEGIYDASSYSDATYTKVYTWPSASGNAGICQTAMFTNDAGSQILIVTDLENGVTTYDGTTWAVPTITGPGGGASPLSRVLVWKHRVWYVERGQGGRAWYSDIGTYSGALTEFNFGSKFRTGGKLADLFSWTLDGGDGPDDYLVAVSTEGDVVIYQGTDPSSAATFGIVGSWNIGPIPSGIYVRNFGVQFGGDLLLLSMHGLVSLRALLREGGASTLEGTLSYKINPTLRERIADNTSFSWDLTVHPSFSYVMIQHDGSAQEGDFQYVFNSDLKAWSIWQLPYGLMTTFDGYMYIAHASTKKVLRVEGHTDNGTDINWLLLTAYNDLEEPQVNKSVEFINPKFQGSATRPYQVRTLYDYAEDGSISTISGSKTESLMGSNGMGKTVAVEVKGTSDEETILVDIGVLYRSGGLL